jgi:type-F conjugative transfer system secretin TraK
MYRTLIFLIFLISSVSSYAVQRFSVADGDQVEIKISMQDVSRLAMKGEGRLKKIWSPENYLDLKPDKVQGEAYFKAAVGAPRTFSFFARDDFGNTFTIVATQSRIPSQTIILEPLNRQEKTVADTNRKSLPYKKSVNFLFKGMFLGKDIPGYSIADLNEPVPVWAETNIRLVKTYISHKFQGEVYEIKNISKAKLDFHESEFFSFGDYVLAAGLEHLSLGVNQVTKLYVVRSKAVGENG